MGNATTEERLAALEAEVARIKAQLDGKRYGVIGRTNPARIEEILRNVKPSAYVDSVWHEIESEREREPEEARRRDRNDYEAA